MQYDFTVVPDRTNTGSSKWDGAPHASVENVPLSTADMEFPTAPPIAQALESTVHNNILGYAHATPEYYQAVCGWMQRRHGFSVTPEQIILTPGIVYALGVLVDAVTDPGDSVLVLTPVYYPFDMSVLAKGRNIVYSTLRLDGTRYTIDYADLTEKAARPDVKALLFCNPHNPVGRVWDREELGQVVDICAANNVFIIDDEIHNDLIMPGYQHTVLATLSETAANICAVCTAPSKTFNLAGLQCSNIIIQNPAICAKVRITSMLNLIVDLNALAYPACIAAYTQCDTWLEELIQTIQGNADYVRSFMAENYPSVHIIPLEGTYLLWLDMRELGFTHVELERIIKEDAGLILDEGYIFGKAGRGFERINLACARTTLEKAMARFKSAMDEALLRPRTVHQTLHVGDVLRDFHYDTASATDLDFAQNISKPTVLIFSRYYSCTICQMTLARLRAAWPAIEAAGLDLKVVLQSTQESVAGAEFPFDLICDPNATLYDRYNVFEADSIVSMVAGSPQLIAAMGGVRQMALSALGGDAPEGRARQLPAVFVITPDMVIRYAHYGKTLDDLPDPQDVVRILQA